MQYKKYNPHVQHLGLKSTLMQYSYTSDIHYIQYIEICIFKTIWGYDIEILYLISRQPHIHSELGIFEIFGITILKYYVYYLDIHFFQHYEPHVLRIFRTIQY